MFPHWLRSSVITFLAGLLPSIAVLAESLPDPLSLQQALRLAERSHPVIAEQEAKLALRQAEVTAVSAKQGFDVFMDLYPRYSRFAANPDRDLDNDSLGVLTAKKQLTDFGRHRSLLDAADAEVRQYEHLLTEVRLRRRVEVMRRFFAVILADLKFHADDEEMTRLFTPYDRARERSQLGMVSPVELLRMESIFREALITRTASDHARRLARTRLALALNHTGELPVNLVRPEFSGIDKEIPAYEKLLATALKQNPAVKALDEKVAAAQLTVAARRALRRPVVTAGLELAEWEKEIGSRRDVTIGLQVHLPIFQGGIEKAAIAKAEAELASEKARAELAQLRLRNTILELLQELETLKTARRTAQTRLQYRELAADEARAEYELELKTTLGQSLARLTEAEYLAARDEFATVLAWVRLEALLGQSTTMLTENK